MCALAVGARIPGPGRWKTLQYGLELLMPGNHVHALMCKLHEVYGPVLGIRNYVMLSGQEGCKFVLSAGADQLQRQPIAEPGPPSLGAMDGAEHKLHRKLVMSAFSPARMAAYSSRMSSMIEPWLQAWTEEQEVFPAFKQLTLDIILATMLGITPDSPYYDRYVTHYWLLLNRGKEAQGPNSRYQQGMRAKDELWAILRELIRERRRHPAQDALSAMLNASEEANSLLSEDDLLGYAYMLTEFGEGDVANLLTYAVAAIALYPELRQAVQQEAEGCAIGDGNYEFALGMKQTLHVIREVERLYPPVPFVARLAVSDVAYKDYIIPKGSTVVANIYLAHRCPDTFTDPLAFDPQRYERAAGSRNSPGALLGFGAGPHMCVAKVFAQHQACLLLAHLLRGYHLERFGPALLPPMDYSGAACPAESIRLKLHRK